MKIEFIIFDTLISIHETQIEEHGGEQGIRDPGLLESALSRPINLYNYEKASIFELAASLGFGIIKNHAFIDGNKRTGYVLTRLLLKLNGYDMIASKEEKIKIIVNLATDAVSETDFANWLKKHSKKI